MAAQEQACDIYSFALIETAAQSLMKRWTRRDFCSWSNKSRKTAPSFHR